MDTVLLNSKNNFDSDNGVTLSKGAIAASCAKAAASSLLLKIDFDNINFRMHDNSVCNIPVKHIPHPENNMISEYAVALSGLRVEDADDVAQIHVSVERVRRLGDISDKAYIKPEFINLYLDGGFGIEVNHQKNEFGPAGYYSIDKDARNLIFQTVADVVRIADIMPLIIIRITATSFNKSDENNTTISGAGGVVVPISQNDILLQIASSLHEQYERDIRNIIAVPGNFAHKYMQDSIHISMVNCIRCRNYIGNTLDMASQIGMENFLLVGNASKLLRLAAGIMDTHSWVADGRREVLALHTLMVGGNPAQVRKLQELATTDQMLLKLTEWGMRNQVMTSVCARISEYINIRIGGSKMQVGVVPMHHSYGILSQTPNISKVLAAVSREQFALSVKKQE